MKNLGPCQTSWQGAYRRTRKPVLRSACRVGWASGATRDPALSQNRTYGSVYGSCFTVVSKSEEGRRFGRTRCRRVRRMPDSHWIWPYWRTNSETYATPTCAFSGGRPGSRPNQVRLRYVPLTSDRFLQTPPLASDALANWILFPVVGARSLTSSDGVCPASLGKQKSGGC